MKRTIREKHIIIWMLLTLLYSLFLVFGHMFDTYGYLCWNSNLNILVLVLGTLLGIPLAYFADFISKRKIKVTCVIESDKRREIRDFAIIMAVNFLCYFILILGVYPGFFVYDAQDEVLQVITRNFSTHHPLLHVLYLGGIVQAGYKIFGSYNAGIFAFTLFQSLCFSYGNTRMIGMLKKAGISRIWLIITDVFLLGFPTLQMAALCSTKDSIFALCVMLWLISFIEKKDWRLIFWSVCMCMFRNNAMYALLVFSIILLFYKKKDLTIKLIVAIVIAVALSTALKIGFKASSGEHQEMLTVPIQQISRMYNYYDGEDGFTDEEKEVLYTYLSEEYLAKYNPKASDYLKYGFNNETYEKDKASFWKLWWTGLKRNPVCYINAWAMTSYAFWYPNALIDAYKGNIVFTFVYDESCYFGYETEQPGTRESMIPFIDNYFRYLSLENVREDMPLVSLILSPGLLAWIYLALFIFMILNKKERNEIPFIYLLLVWATLILGPLSLPRYVFYLWYCLPIAIFTALKTNVIKNTQE